MRAAIRGPDGENWYEDEKCDCSRKMALMLLDAARESIQPKEE